MLRYHKIHGLWQRNTKGKILDYEVFSKPEFKYLRENQWMWTEKIDGMNVRIHWDPGYGEVKFGGRNENSQMPMPLLAHLQTAFSFEKLKANYPDFPLTFYGEGFGGAIQRAGATYAGTQRFILFDVRVGDYWLERSSVADVADKMELDIVPIVDWCSVDEAVKYVRYGLISSFGDFKAEGVVGIPSANLFNRYGERIITKIKAKDFA